MTIRGSGFRWQPAATRPAHDELLPGDAPAVGPDQEVDQRGDLVRPDEPDERRHRRWGMPRSVPMFHCNGWCFPWAVTAAAATHVCLPSSIPRRCGGSSARKASPTSLVGADLDGVLVLRGLDDARALRDRLDTARTVFTVGAGFIGLEVAAAAHKRGVHAVVVDVAAQLSTAAPPELAMSAAGHGLRRPSGS